MANLYWTVWLAMTGIMLVGLAYVGPFREYLNDKAKEKIKIYVIDGLTDGTVTVQNDGRSKTWSREEFYRRNLDSP